MIVGMAIALLVFSLYTLFVSGDALDFGLALMRVALSVVAVVAAHFPDEGVVSTVVMLFSVLSVALLAITRGEVQKR
jgi:hypothetical protein